MKQTRLMKMLFVPAALSFFAACSSDNDIVGDKNPTEDKGVTLTINATAGADAAMSRVQYNNDYSVEWTSTDQVYAFAGSTANAGKCGITTTADKHNAKLTVTLPTTPKNGDKITAYVANNGISAVNAKTEGLGDQIEVDYSKQDGTYADATSRCVLFGETTYNSESELSMNFEYQTTFLKLTLNFPETTVAGEAALYLTGDNVYSISRMNTTGANAGQLGNQNGFTITVPSVNVSAGQAKDIYIAMYPGQVQNVKLQAVMTDGKTYEFTLGNATLVAGKVYKIAKNGTKVATEAATKFAGGDGSEVAPYEISNLAELKYLQKMVSTKDDFSKDKYFKLTSDITINGTWKPIGESGGSRKWFLGTFNGNGHSINGSFTFEKNSNKAYGLFSVISGSAVVKNLVNKANIIVKETEANTLVGSIVGRIRNGGKVVNCSNYGMIESTGDVIGGIVGNIYLENANTAAIVEACCNYGNIKSLWTIDGNSFLGGIVGTQNFKSGVAATSSKIVGCSCSNITMSSSRTTKLFAGGIITNVSNYTNADQLQIVSCWSSNIVYPSANYLGGIIGTYSKVKYILNNCWTDASKLNVTQASPNYEVTNSKTSKEEPNLSNMIEGMNTAWQTAASGTTFKFDATGAIVNK